LLLTAAQVIHSFQRSIQQTHPIQGFEGYVLLVFGQGEKASPRTVVPKTSHKHVSQGSLCRDELVLLKDHACFPPELAQLSAIRADPPETLDMDFPAGGPAQEVEAAQERGLACARRSEQYRKVPLVQGEAGRSQCLDATGIAHADSS
jgi:hypothetical protein